MKNFDRKLDEALTEAMKDGTIFLPWVHAGEIFLHRCRINKLVYYGSKGYAARDFGVRGTPPGKFVGFYVTTEDEEAPMLVPLDAAEFGEELSKHVEDEVPDLPGVFQLHPDVASDDDTLGRAERLSKYELEDQDAILSMIGIAHRQSLPG